MFNISWLLHRLSGENPEKSGRIDAFTFGSGVIISLSLAMSVFSSEPGTLFPVDLGGPIYSSAIVADIDQDGMDEILVGSDSDKLFCLDANGLTKWQYQTGDDVRSSPALGDIDQDGYLDVVFQSEDGYLYVLDKDGQTLPGWPRPLGSIPYNSYYTATPVLADIDGDSELEIITLSPYRETFNTIRVYAFNSDGETEWTWEKDWPGTESISAHAVTSPAVADVNGDGILEVVVYFNITYHYPSGPGVGIYVIRGTDHQLVYEREWSIPITYSSPSIADINKDGKLEVILSCYYPGAFTSVQAITIEDDFVLWGWYDNPRIDNLSLSSPVIGNINSEFYPEIVPGGNLITLEHDGDIIWWNNDVYSINSSTVLGDIDNDEQMEIFTAASYSGEIHGFDGDGTELDGFPLETDPDYSIQATPVLCDRDRDGYMDIIVGSTDGKLYHWETTYMYNEPGMASAAFRDDIRRTGHYRPVVGIELSPDEVEVAPGERVEIEIVLTNSSHRSHTLQYSLSAKLPTGRSIPILTDYPPEGVILDGYESETNTISIPVPSGAPSGIDILLVGKVSSLAGYTTDGDNTVVHIQ